MAIEEEFTWKEMNKTLDSRCDQLIMVMSNDQAVEVQKGKIIPNTQIGKLEASMIFQIQESIKMDDVMEEASSNIFNPPKCRKISFSQSIPRIQHIIQEENIQQLEEIRVEVVKIIKPMIKDNLQMNLGYYQQQVNQVAY